MCIRDSDRLKEFVELSEYDLLDSVSSSPPASIYGDFDIVMCCNVLFYYKPAFQKLILDKFTRSISSGGFLITGEAESGIVNSARGFRHYLSPGPLFEKM
jgi:chemotaxis methyl-accepting protein methylase